MIKKALIILGLITVPFLYVFDDELFDIADVRCRTVKRYIAGNPIKMCSIAFDDKGLIAEVTDIF